MHRVGYKEDQHLNEIRSSSTWIVFLLTMEASESMPDQNKEEGSQLNEVPPRAMKLFHRLRPTPNLLW
jgi:hypothetical protein